MKTTNLRFNRQGIIRIDIIIQQPAASGIYRFYSQVDELALDAVGAADDQHSVVEHLQRALRLGGKVHMAGGVQQGDIRTSRFQQGLLGKDGDATRLFQRVGVEEGIFVIHPAQLADAARAVEHRLGEGGLAGVYMGKDECVQAGG